MARIAEAEIERLKAEISLVRLVETSGVRLEKRGKDWAVLCPFHEEATPSFVVTPDKNLFRCFGCGVAGGPIDWVMKRQGVSFRHAVELLREGLPLAAELAAAKRSTARSLAPPVSFDADDRALLNQVAGYYHETLKQSPEALAYLQARGLVHSELIERFTLGYANRKSGVALFPKESFEVVSPTVASTWIASWSSKDFFQLAPERWAQAGFWERFYDQEPDAIHIFEEERKAIEADP